MSINLYWSSLWWFLLCQGFGQWPSMCICEVYILLYCSVLCSWSWSCYFGQLLYSWTDTHLFLVILLLILIWTDTTWFGYSYLSLSNSLWTDTILGFGCYFPSFYWLDRYYIWFGQWCWSEPPSLRLNLHVTIPVLWWTSPGTSRLSEHIIPQVYLEVFYSSP